MIPISVIALFTSLLTSHISPIPSSTVLNLNSIIKPSFSSESSDSQQQVLLPDAVVHSHDYQLISSSIVVKGQNQTVLRYLSGTRDRENQVATKEATTPPSKELNSLFNLYNASLSVSRLILDLSSETVNHDVRCAVLASSTIHVSFCKFLWNDVKSLFVLGSNSPSAQTSSSITLIWCTLNNTIHYLNPIVDDMRKDSTAEAFNMNMVGTELANMKVVGADGVCVSQTIRRNSLSSFEGISTTVSELRIMNVSSLPGEVKQASSLFSQRMIGCAMWGSNNHLSGSLLRDVNGGGSFLCSNSTFDWCHTTSSERPSVVHTSSTTITNHSFSTTRSISNQEEPEDDPNDPYTGKSNDDVTRLSITNVEVTFTRCESKNMKYTNNELKDQIAGGSAIYVYASKTTVSIMSCHFSKCSITSTWTVWGGCVYLYNLSTSPNTVDSCSFEDWYPTNGTNANQFGGGIGTIGMAVPFFVTNSNFTLSGETTNKYNGGFFAYNSAQFIIPSITITNCRLIGDLKTTGTVIKLATRSSYLGFFSVTDSQILNTYSKVDLTGTFETSAFTRTEITQTYFSLYPSVTKFPHLFLDCKLNRTSFYTGSANRVMILFSGTSFTGRAYTSSMPTINFAHISHVVFHECDFTDCTPAASQSLIDSFNLPSLVVDTCTFTRCTGGSTVVAVHNTHAFFYFCSFTNVSGTSANVMTISSSSSNFFEACRFDLEEDPTALDREKSGMII